MEQVADRSEETQELALAFVLTVTAAAVSSWRLLQVLWQRYVGGSASFTYPTTVSLVFLALGLVLAIPARHRSGLTFGRQPDSWLATAAVVGLPVLCVAIIYPILPERPFAGASRDMWLLSPVAQDLWFLGVLYGRLDAVFHGHVHQHVPIRQALPLTALFFALWHLPNLLSTMSPGYVAFQLSYVFVGCVLVGLSRQWTGTIIYATLSHMAVNYIAWSTA
jgi:membrane protease YdiL (CAAX protease family)